LLTIFGGRVDDLKTVLIEERLPDAWQSRVVTPMGITFITMNSTSLKLERSIDENKYKEQQAAAGNAAAQSEITN
jgi:hypothetical protein